MSSLTNLQEGIPEQRVFAIEDELHIVVGSPVEQLLLCCRVRLKVTQEHIPEDILQKKKDSVLLSVFQHIFFKSKYCK